MKLLNTFLFTLLFLSSYSQTEYGCDGTRYFSSINLEYNKETVQYGSNLGPIGSLVNLNMDIYSPQNDNVELKPLIIFAHGGSFIGGNRSEMEDFCIRMTARGYFAATIDYRVLNIINGIPDSTKAMDIAVKASHDMKGAIRWFQHSIDEEGNPYSIDKNMIFLGGYSAGAITALLTGIVDESEISNPFINQLYNDNGGFEGDTGDETYAKFDGEIRGIINLSGALYDTTWIDVNDPIIASFHGDKDDIVPYDYDYVKVFSVPIIPLHGSSDIYARTEHLGITGKLTTIPNGGHTNIYTDAAFETQRGEFLESVDQLFGNIICSEVVKSQEVEERTIVPIFPNPVTDFIYLPDFGGEVEISVYNTLGERVGFSANTCCTWDANHLLPGNYLIIIKKDSELFQAQFSKI